MNSDTSSSSVESLHPSVPVFPFANCYEQLQIFSLLGTRLLSPRGVGKANSPNIPCPRLPLRMRTLQSHLIISHTTSTSRAIPWKVEYFCGRTQKHKESSSSCSFWCFMSPKLLIPVNSTILLPVCNWAVYNRSWHFHQRKDLSSFIRKKKNLLFRFF